VRVLVTGAAGQLGRELVRTAPPDITCRAVDRAGLDISDAQAVSDAIGGFQPTLIINAAAYTAVDKAETQASEAQRVNVEGPELLAQAAAGISGCRLLHVSTDYVFSGEASRPYRPVDETNPHSVYGRTKLEGEHAVRALLGARALVLRTAWVYDSLGPNFLCTMLRLMRERGNVRVVADQIGCPTTTRSLSRVVWSLAAQPALGGTFHWSDAGVASWYDFAIAIAEEAASRGLLAAGASVAPIATEDYPTPARRPRFSLLDSSSTVAALGIAQQHWRVGLRQVLDDIRHG
jgi:dTDP-4-dehydrorhamnose reductase